MADGGSGAPREFDAQASEFDTQASEFDAQDRGLGARAIIPRGAARAGKERAGAGEAGREAGRA